VQPHVTPPPLTIPHLFRDCPRLETKRREAIQAASDIAIGLSVPGSYAHAPMQRAMALQHHHNWYRLMMGASVPSSFLRCPGVFRSFGDGRGLPSERVAQNIAAYRPILAPLDNFLEFADAAVREVVATHGAELGHEPVNSASAPERSGLRRF
jgi:hypothetical protein